MLRKPLVTLMAIGALCVVDARIAGAATITITNSDSGWYDNTGFHDPSEINYIAGQFFDSHWHDFFVFDLAAAVGQTITSAQLQLYTHTISSTGTYTNYDVTTPIALLTGGGGGLGAYADLGGGASFGSINLMPGQSDSLVLINLNAAAIAAIQANVGGLFAIGGDYLGDGGSEDFAFGFSGFNPTNTQNQLILQTTSVPDGGLTMSLLSGTLMALGMLRRKLKR
jgi:hypothetical protein